MWAIRRLASFTLIGRRVAIDVIVTLVLSEDSARVAVPRRFYYGGGPVVVVCTGIASFGSVECHETAVQEWQRLFPGDDPYDLLERAAAEPQRVSPH